MERTQYGGGSGWDRYIGWGKLEGDSYMYCDVVTGIKIKGPGASGLGRRGRGYYARPLASWGSWGQGNLGCLEKDS